MLPFWLGGRRGRYVFLCPPRRLVCRIEEWVERLQSPGRIWRNDRRSCDRQIRVVWICIAIRIASG